MNIPLMSLSLLDPLYSLFGYVMRFIYAVFGNYGFSIIIFTVLVRLIILPLNVKQHKSTLQQQALRPQLLDLQRYYGDDREGLAQAQAALYEKHNVSLTGGCLTALLSLVIMWPVYRIINGPLYFIMQVPEESLNSIGDILVNAGVIEGVGNINLRHNSIFIIQALFDNPQVFAEVVDKGLMSVNQLLDMDFFGINLGMKPTINFSLIFSEQWTTYLPLLLFPLIATGGNVLQMWYSQKVNSPDGMTRAERKEAKEKAKKNPALQDDQAQAAQGAGKTMMFIMPIMTLFFTFNMPVAMSLYWIVSSLIGLFQVWLMNKIYTEPMAERQAISDAKYEEKVTARARKEQEKIEELEAKQNKKKRRRRKK